MNKQITSLVTGPTDRSKIYRFGSIEEKDYSRYIENIGENLSMYLDRIDIIPDDGVPLDIAKAYKKFGGPSVVGYIPKNNHESLLRYIKFCDKIEEFDSGWTALNTCLSLKSGLIISVGLSPGTIVELAYTKYHKKFLNKNIPLLVDLRSIGDILPLSITEDLDVRYFSNNNELKRILENLKQT